jgi:hypothetical protein
VVVTVTVTAPAAPGAVVAVIDVPLTTTTLVAATPPNVTVAPAVKFVPVIVTAVPPGAGPRFGDTLLTVGGETYVNPPARLPLCPPGLLTVTATAPDPAGLVAVIVVPLTTTTLVAAAAPNVTVSPSAKFVPVIVTAVAPVYTPPFGLTLLTEGKGPAAGMRNATICMIHGPEGARGAVAL